MQEPLKELTEEEKERGAFLLHLFNRERRCLAITHWTSIGSYWLSVAFSAWGMALVVLSGLGESVSDSTMLFALFVIVATFIVGTVSTHRTSYHIQVCFRLQRYLNELLGLELEGEAHNGSEESAEG